MVWTGFVQPMAARLVTALPEGPEWLYELKFDSYRALVIKDGRRVRICSRNNREMTAVYPTVAAAGQRVHARQTVIDGEIVAVNAEGRPSFQALQHRGAYPDHQIAFYAFDLLHLDGADLMTEPLHERRAKLPPVLEGSGILMSIELPGTGPDIIAAVRGLGLEGILAKRKDSRYTPGDRHTAWVKLKLDQQQEFVIGGYRPAARGVDALLVGYYEGRDLRFAGKVRAGFTPLLRREVLAALQPLAAGRCPFADLPNARTSHWGGGVTAEQMREMQWLLPKVAAQIRFVEWTADKKVRDIRRET